MKNLALIVAVSITVIILIIAFQNIRTISPFVMFFSFDSTPLTLPILFVSILGMVAGSLYTVFLRSAVKKSAEEDEDSSDDQF